MGKINLLDCTLRDGGYVNNWNFGKACIDEFVDKLVDAGVDIMELGFMRDEKYNVDRSIFTSADTLARFKKKDSATLYSVMIEGNESNKNFPINKMGKSSETGIDLIRICTWKRLMNEHIDYCAEVQNRMGYYISIQPTAIDQYDDAEFLRLIELVNQIKPFAFYLVDTWGTQSATDICHYAKLADENLAPETKLGYHGHNNKMQAINCVEAITKMNLTRDLCIDSTVMGMGRGPGNLQTEVVIDFLNKNCGGNYDLLPIIELYSKYIKDVYKNTPWGYSVYHFISANCKLPQDFATYFNENDYSIEDFNFFIDNLKPEERVVFKENKVRMKLTELGILK